MVIVNRYDKLMEKAKKLRNKIERRTTKDNARVEKLQSKISQIKYKKTVYCQNINNKLKDTNSLISNERDRIEQDKIAFEYENPLQVKKK